MIKEEESFFDTEGLVARDRIAVEVTAHDPAATGNSLKSEPLVLGNSTLKIISSPPGSDSPKARFEYTVKTIDRWHPSELLSGSAPTGMSISETSGHIMADSARSKGNLHVKVVAKDGHGGMATQEFEFDIDTITSSSGT